MRANVAIPQTVLAFQNLSGQHIEAPVEIWVGCLIQSLPPSMREEIIGLVSQYIEAAAQQGQPSRIIMP